MEKPEKFNFEESARMLETKAKLMANQDTFRTPHNDQVVLAAAELLRGVGVMHVSFARYTKTFFILMVLAILVALFQLFLAIPKEVHCTELEDGNLACTSYFNLKGNVPENVDLTGQSVSEGQ